MTADDVRPGQTWTRADPSGRVDTFRILRVIRDEWNNRSAVGAVGGKRIRCRVSEMVTSERFALVGEALPGASACVICREEPRAGTRVRAGVCARCYSAAWKAKARAKDVTP